MLARLRLLSAAVTALTVCATTAQSQDSVPGYVTINYQRHDFLIPMRDGVRLRTIVFTPRDSAVSYPILLTRTPYGADTYFHPLGPAESFARAGYIFAFQDVRGKYLSEGQFTNVPPFHERPAAGDIDEATDTYDTIDWLLKNVPRNNGRVGQYGISYLGYYSTLGILSAHPALKAVSPQAPVTDWFIGDDIHHNGAFFLNDFFDFLSGFGVDRPVPTNRRDPGLRQDFPDAYSFFLHDVGTLANVNERYFHHQVAFWDTLMMHGTYDTFFKHRTPLPHLRDVKPAVMTVGGWFDAEDLWGTLNVFKTIEGAKHGSFNGLVMGPWFHAGWFLTDGGTFADLTFPTKTADDYHAQVELPFFEYFLKDKGSAPSWKAFVYETGANEWHRFDVWPPAGLENRTFYFGANHILAVDAPRGAVVRGFDEYSSDPEHPVPYIGYVQSERGADYMGSDQRFAAERPDVLTYETAPLDADLTIAGPITARLTVSTTGTDADWIVKVIDVFPDDAPNPQPNPRDLRMGGYQQLVRAEVMRGKFRNSLEHPEPFVPGQATPLVYTLPDAFHRFKKGHRIMVQVQSSWFPLVDRNPQKFVDIYRATAADFQSARMRVYRGSSIELGVVEH